MLNDAGAWTYGEMKDLSDRIARLLVEREGLVPGNRVFLRGPNNAMLFASWLGVLKAGGVVVTHHADAAPRRDRDHPRARPDQPRHRRRPLPRRFRRGGRHRLDPHL